MDLETLKQENDTYKKEIQQLIQKIKHLEEENKKYKKNFSFGLPQGFSGHNQ